MLEKHSQVTVFLRKKNRVIQRKFVEHVDTAEIIYCMAIIESLDILIMLINTEATTAQFIMEEIGLGLCTRKFGKSQ